MDVVGTGSLLTDLIGRIAGAWSNRPRLRVKITLFRPDPARRRLVFRASVLNYGRATATHCEGFWTVFGPDLNELEGATAVFWCPLKDDDYNFDNRDFTLATIGYNERRFCWAELHITEAPVKGTGVRLFPYDCPAGRYKSFDFVGVEVPGRTGNAVSVRDAIEKLEVHWSPHRGVRRLLRRRRLAASIVKTDYHDYIRPT